MAFGTMATFLILVLLGALLMLWRGTLRNVKWKESWGNELAAFLATKKELSANLREKYLDDPGRLPLSLKADFGKPPYPAPDAMDSIQEGYLATVLVGMFVGPLAFGLMLLWS